MIFLLPLEYLGTFVENQLTVYVWAYFWAIVYLTILTSNLFTTEHLHSWAISSHFSSYVFFLTAYILHFLKSVVNT